MTNCEKQESGSPPSTTDISTVDLSFSMPQLNASGHDHQNQPDFSPRNRFHSKRNAKSNFIRKLLLVKVKFVEWAQLSTSHGLPVSEI